MSAGKTFTSKLFGENLVTMSNTTLEIQTLGRFCISINGKPVAIEWPDETLKVFFCSMLSPLDLSFSWGRISRAMWGLPVCRLQEIFVWPLASYLNGELGFNPLIAVNDGVRLDKQCIKVDAHEFYKTVVEGLRQISFANHAAALYNINRAISLYSGSHLPGIPGKINTETRSTLKSLYQSAINDALPIIRNSAAPEIQTSGSDIMATAQNIPGAER